MTTMASRAAPVVSVWCAFMINVPRSFRAEEPVRIP
jgi:hypothetical protein